MQHTDESDAARERKDRNAARERLLALMLEADGRRRRVDRKIAPRVRDGGAVPLSFPQERLWFLDQLGLVETAYNMPLALRLCGPLNVAALELSLTELVRRHESLRTRFESIDGSPLQFIDPPTPFRLPLVQDLSELQEDEKRSQMHVLIADEARHPFDLTRAPLFRASLLKLAENDHILLLTMHHIVSDGWSLAILNRELGALYEAFSQQRGSPLPPLPIQYADYALWQRDWLQGQVLRELLQYWRETLRGAPAQLQLPADRMRPAVESFRGAVYKFELPAKQLDALNELARGEGATLFMVCLAAFQTLLSRWTGQEDVVVGSPIAGRTQAQTEGLIGFFVNMLTLRTDISGNPTFRTLLARVRDVTLGAYAHQDLPFEKLVEELRPERTLARQSLIQVTLALQNFPQEQLQLPGLTWTSVGVRHATTRFDLTLHLYVTGGGLGGTFEYATDLFDETTMARMGAQLCTLLEAATQDPDCPVQQLPLLSQDERHRLLVEWNRTRVNYPEGACVHEIFSAQARRTPDSTAIIDRLQRFTYREIELRSNQLAQYLCSLGVRPEVIVGLYLERSVDLVIGLLGILKAGGAYLPLEPAYPVARLRFMIKNSGAAVLLTRAALAGTLESHNIRTVCFDDDRSEIDGSPHVAAESGVVAQNLAYVIYTSGSTGTPKGVMVEHVALLNYLHWAMHAYAAECEGPVPISSPLAFDATGTALYCALLSGRAVVLLPDGQELESLEQLLTEPSGHWSLIKVSPAHLQALGPRLQNAKPPRTLCAVVVGGEALPIATARLWRSVWPDIRIFNQYGPTETVVACSAYEIPLDAPISGSGFVQIGRPAPNCQFYVLDGNLQPVPVGVPGELFIGGAQLSRGYIGNPALTAERFVADPHGPYGRRKYRTGDRVRYMADGNPQYIGRADTQVKIRGYRIELGEIESLLCAHEAVKEAVVLAREDVPGEKRLVSYLVGDRGAAAAVSGGIEEKLRNESVSQWEAVHEGTYEANPIRGPSFIGWNSSYTGEPIPETEMQEWLACTLQRIRALRPGRVLEIGCGVGLLLQHLAPECSVYVGADFSASAVNQLHRWRSGRADLAHVRLLHRAATELGDLEASSFDTIILNSVVQYFPDIEYLVDVLEGAVRLLRPGGHIFLGDIRHLGTLRMFHSAVQLSKAAARVTVEQLRRRVERALTHEKELVIDPDFFCVLPTRLAGIAEVSVQMKRGRASNELTRYRYDVVLRAGEATHLQHSPAQIQWSADASAAGLLETALQERRWAEMSVKSIPNARLARDAAAQEYIETGDERAEASSIRRKLNQLRHEHIDPEEIWHWTESYGYAVSATPGDGSCFDVQILDPARSGHVTPGRSRTLRSDQPWSAFANDPLENSFRQQLVVHVREYLKQQLPDYMIPSAWVVLKQLPLTRNGKIDRRALPNPQGRPDEVGEYVPPGTETERGIAEIWAELLQVDQVGVNDNFFELGGHSLHAVKLISQVTDRFMISLPLLAVFQCPTVKEIAALVESLRSDVRESVRPDEEALEGGVI